MATREGPPPMLEVPQREIVFIPAKAGEILPIGTMTARIMEDGSNTDNRLGALELIIPPRTSGPAPHWHEMHDETFLVTKGTVRFSTPGLEGHHPDVDAKAGDYVSVPIRAPHTFSNPFDEEARFFNTLTPSFYVNYFKLLSELAVKNGSLAAEVNKTAMSVYATMAVNK